MNKNTQALVFPINAKRELILKSIKNLSYFVYFMRNISKSSVKYPFYLKGNPNEDEGAIFIQIFDEYIKVYSKIKTMIETDYFVRIIYEAYKTIPTSFEFEYIITIFFTGFEKCFLVSNFRYSKKISLPKPSISDERQKRVKLFLNIQRKLIENELNKFNIEEILINAPFKLVFDIFLNFKLVNKYIKIFGKIIEYNGNIIKDNMIVNIIGKENLLLTVKIEKIEKNEKECLIQFTKEYNNEINKQEKIIFLIYGEGQKTMIYMMNFFNYFLSDDNLKKLTTDKKNMLYKLKTIIENYLKSQRK